MKIRPGNGIGSPITTDTETAYRIEFPGEGDKKISMTSSGFAMDGSPFFPIMGELHYTRIPRQYWREHLLKMKSAGINVISTYVFWIHHEEQRGLFNWEGRRDLRAFLELCRSLGFFVFLRLGPWCHGEVRNGGFPDWIRWGIMRKRSFFPRYMAAVEEYFTQVLKQCSSFAWNEGGPVLGVQLENEFHIRTKRDVTYLMKLKEMVIRGGMKVPVYALTGWPLSVYFPHTEFLPFWGDYPATPWASHTGPVSREQSFRFSASRIPEDIGSDLLRASALNEKKKDLKNNPYTLVELGLSNQICDKRRPSFTKEDGYAMALVKAGSGASWMGYYMFSGGTNPLGKSGSLEENRATFYPNTYPKLSYDFHAPVGEWGRLKPSYYPVKNLHYLLRDFASLLLEGSKILVRDEEDLSWSYRGSDDGGFIFINRYRRGASPGNEIRNRCFTLPESDSKSLNPVLNLPTDLCTLIPAGLKTGALRMEWASVLPLGKGSDSEINEYFFGIIKDIAPSFVFSDKPVIISDRGDWTVRKKGDDHWEVYPGRTLGGAEPYMTLNLLDPAGNTLRYILVSEEQTGTFWKDYDSGVILTGPESVLFNEDSMEMEFNDNNSFFYLWDSSRGVFKEYEVRRDLTALSVDTVFLGKKSGRSVWEIRPDYCWMETDSKERSEVFLSFEYRGDKAELYLDDQLMADHFNQGSPWELSLSRLIKLNGAIPLRLELRLQKRSQIKAVYIEGPVSRKDLSHCRISKCSLHMTYKITKTKKGENYEKKSM